MHGIRAGLDDDDEPSTPAPDTERAEMASPEDPSRVRPDVLVTQGWGRVAFNIVRSLGRQGLKVVVGADAFRGMAFYSKYTTARFRHPFLTTETAAFVACVKDALQRFAPRVYLPAGEDAYVAARHIEQLRVPGVAIPLAPFDTMKKLMKKDEVAELAKSLGIPTPVTMSPRSYDDLWDFCLEYGSSNVLKRISSSGARGVFYLTSHQITALSNGDSPASSVPLRDCVVQQYVRGSGVGVSMLFNQGQLRAKFAHKRLREKTSTGGISTLRVGVTNPILEEYAQRLLQSVKFHGVAMVEFRHDERTGKNWLIEVNPRFWGSLALAIQSGVDFPYLLYRMATDGDVAPITNHCTGRIVRWISGDVRAVANRWPSLKNMFSIFREGPRADGYDDYYEDDPLPFFASIPLSLWKLVGTAHWPPEAIDVSIDRL